MQQRDSVKSNAEEDTFYIAEQIDCASGKNRSIMKRLTNWLLSKNIKKTESDYPTSMQELRANGPCWCGSDKPYRKCHRPEDRKREKALGLDRKGKSICDAFT